MQGFETGHWITILIFILTIAIGFFEAVFWFLIRNLQERDKELQDDFAKLNDSFQACQHSHDTTGATKSDMMEIKGAVSAVHRRLDQILLFLVQAGVVKPEDAMRRGEGP